MLKIILILTLVFQFHPQFLNANTAGKDGLVEDFTIKGHVYSLPKRQPIAFANIGIVGSSSGTISDMDGSFTLHISSKYARDTILFSALGYESIKVPIQELRNNKQISIYLRGMAFQLPEVVVTEERKKSKLVTYGIKNSDGGTVYADVRSAGSAMALLIQNQNGRGRTKFEYPMYIHEAQVMIENNTFERFKLRARLYDVEKVGDQLLPGKDILNESVVIESEISEGWLKFDLSPYRVQVKNDFFIVFEWILEKQDRAMLHYQFEQFKRKYPDQVKVDYSYVNGQKIAYDNFQGNFYFGTSLGVSVDKSLLKNYICYYRLNSQGQWFPSPTTLAARVSFGKYATGDAVVYDTEEVEELNELPSHYFIRSVISAETNGSTQGNARRTFKETRDEPVEVVVFREHNTLSMFAVNESNYPYEVTLGFSDMVNLKPIVTSKSFVVYSGKTHLIDFEASTEQKRFYYKLSVKGAIGDPKDKPMLDFPYLIPVGALRSIALPSTAVGAPNLFTMSKNDTVFAMRRGIVTSTLQLSEKVNKISGQPSVEVLHDDGTVMVYQQLDSTEHFLTLGQNVVPGTPIGIMGQKQNLLVELFRISPEGFISNIPIRYYQESGGLVTYSELNQNALVIYPDHIIQLEMPEKEN